MFLDKPSVGLRPSDYNVQCSINLIVFMEKVNFLEVVRECIEAAAIVGSGMVLVFLSLTVYGAMA